jgi:hypothetical protein
MGLRPTQGDENAFCPRPLSHGRGALIFVISTEAQRSGEISVLTRLPGNVFRPELNPDIGQLSYIQTCLQPDDSMLFL